MWVHALAAPVGGGATYLDAVLPRLVRRLTERGADVTVLCSPAGEELAGRSGATVRVFFAWAARGALARIVFDQIALPVLARRNRVAAVLCLGSFAPVVCPVRSVVLVRNTIYFDPELLDRTSRKRKLRWPLERLLIVRGATASDAVVYPSTFMRSLVEGRTRLRRRRLTERGHVVPYGVDERLLERHSDPLRAVGVESALLRVFVPTSATIQKNLGLVIRAVARASGDGTPVQVEVTVTFDDLDADLQRLVIEHRLLESDRLVLCGPLDRTELARRLWSADMCVLASWSESFGHPAVEALAAGCPVVAADRPWAREVCGDHATYVDPSDPRTLAELWSTWPRDRPVVPEPHLVAARFSWDRHADAVVELLVGPGGVQVARGGPVPMGAGKGSSCSR